MGVTFLGGNVIEGLTVLQHTWPLTPATFPVILPKRVIQNMDKYAHTKMLTVNIFIR